ncbi:MAG: hypothetical protein AAFX00_06665, partial [Pseudomonadota bacterium]
QAWMLDLNVIAELDLSAQFSAFLSKADGIAMTAVCLDGEKPVASIGDSWDLTERALSGGLDVLKGDEPTGFRLLAEEGQSGTVLFYGWAEGHRSAVIANAARGFELVGLFRQYVLDRAT